MANKATFNFETAFDKLNKLVEKMESGGLSLGESLKKFEEGIGLIRQCQAELQAAEQKVQMLVEENLVPYHTEE